MGSVRGLYARRFAASAIDYSIELGGGLLGSYFGFMVAALLTALKNSPADQMASSMWSGFGFGFVFWFLSVSFMNRVLIQGLSRASIGKKVFKLELISTSQALNWTSVTTRWVLSFASLATGGLGYLYSIFDPEHRAFHDVIVHTDVVPTYVGTSMSVEYREESRTIDQVRQMMVLSNTYAERPMATLIKFPVKPKSVQVEEDEALAEDYKKSA